MRRDELYHYGVKGMKWRFRKAGRKELGEGSLDEKSPNNPADFTKSINRTKNSTDPSSNRYRVVRNNQYYRQRHTPFMTTSMAKAKRPDRFREDRRDSNRVIRYNQTFGGAYRKNRKKAK